MLARTSAFGHLFLLFFVAGCAEEGLPLGPHFDMTPAKLDFGAVRVDGRKTQAVQLTNLVDEDLAIDIRRDASTLDVFVASRSQVTLPAAGGLSFEVAFTPAAAIEFSGAFTVSHADGNGGRTLEVSGRGAAPSDCEGLMVMPSSVAFGNVVVGTSHSDEIQVTNCSDVDATVVVEAENNVRSCSAGPNDPSSFCYELEDGTVAPDGSFSLAAGETATMTLTFAPVIAGARERGSFVLSACDGEACATTVTLDGLGVESGLLCSPPSLEFGQISPGACHTLTASCENLANRTLEITSWGPATRGGVPTSPDFSFELAAATVLETGDTIDIDVTYCPDALGGDRGTLGIETNDPDARFQNYFLPLEGRGGGPELSILPAGCIDFGPASTLAPVRRTVLVANTGFDTLDVSEIVVDTLQTGAFTASNAEPGRLEPGDAAPLTIEFRPQAAGPVESAVLIRTNDPDTPETTVCLRGEGVVLPPCQFQISTASLDFGDVPVGHERRRDVQIENIGTEDCLIGAGPGFSPGSDSAFTAASGAATTQRVPAGAAATFEITFTPPGAQGFSGAIPVQVSSPTSPFNEIVLSGAGIGDGLFAAPSGVDFGDFDLGCQAITRPVRVYNLAATAATVTAVAIEPSNGTAFGLTQLPALPATIPSGGHMTFEVGFDSSSPTDDAGAIRIDGAGSTVYVALRAEVSAGAEQVDVFENVGAGPRDVLIVADNSASMADEHAELAENFGALVDYAEANAIDYQIGITTAGIDTEMGRLVHPEDGGLFDGSPALRIVRPGMPQGPAAVFAANLELGGTGSGGPTSESGLEASRLAIGTPMYDGYNAGFSRREAGLSIIWLSDEEDQSPLSDVALYVDWFASTKGYRRPLDVTGVAIAGEGPGGCSGPHGVATAAPRYLEAARALRGHFQSICTSNWDAASSDVGLFAFGYPTRFPLSTRPVISTLEISIDGVLVPATTPGGVDNWTYDFATNSVEPAAFSPLMPGSTVQIRYIVECP